MRREFWDLLTFALTEPIKIGIELIDDIVDSVDKKIDTPFKSFEIHQSKQIEPSFGSPIYTELGFGITGHSGIYIGNRKVISLNGEGKISENTLEEFTRHTTTFNHEIYVPCYKNQEWSIGFADAGGRAIEKIGTGRNYHLFFDNCHQFCAGCITGDFENDYNFLWMVKDIIEKKHGDKIRWKKWDWKK